MKKPIKKSSAADSSLERKSRGRRREDASFPVSPGRGKLPKSYAAVLGEIKERIRSERLRVVMTANAAMVILYWDIGRMILDRQEKEGWGARVIDRLSADLRGSLSGYAGAFATKPEVHARFCSGLATKRNCARTSCTNTLVPSHRAARKMPLA